MYGPVQKQNPEMLLLHAGRQPVLWVLDGIFQSVKGAQEPEMGLEIRDIDQRRHFVLADGKSRGELSRVFGVGRRRLFASRRGSWETNLAKGRHGVGLGLATRRWQRPSLSGGDGTITEARSEQLYTLAPRTVTCTSVYREVERAGLSLARCWQNVCGHDEWTVTK
jgi:hypothetical protein